MEIDYNMHKSNSTYFADMDISRTQLFTAIIRKAIRKGSKGQRLAWPGAGATQGTESSHIIAMGGIACNFKREILPYKKYEMWTRLLSWDRKWFYLVTHLVKPGVGRPSSFTLQPWKKPKAGEVDTTKLQGAVYGTAIAKYVIKKGRVTIPAEQVLIDAEMVPAKPEDWVYAGDEAEGVVGEVNGHVDNGHFLFPKVEGETWDWNTIERERRRGLKLAEAFAQLDGLVDCWDGGKEGVLGVYPDL
jgi:hypothetical protein